MAAPGWWVGATCRKERIPLSVFFGRDTVNKARGICKECPVRIRCLTDHLDEPFGVWGGHPRDERTQIMSAIEDGTSIRQASTAINSRRLR